MEAVTSTNERNIAVISSTVMCKR